MKRMVYPKKAKRMLQVRDCTVAICNNNNPASVLLSTLLFWFDYPRDNDTFENNIFTTCRTQADIELASCNQINAKTIHDTAVPFLWLFGYLTVKEKMGGNLYSLNMNHVNAAFAAYDQGEKVLKDFLKSSLQLESAPIKISPDQLESILINKSQLYLQLEETLIQIRADSNCKRGRKPRVQEALEGETRPVETLRDQETKKRESKLPSLPSSNGKNEPPSKQPTEQPVPKITLNETEQAFWALWCAVSFNQDIPPDLNETAYKHIPKLAPLITTKEQLDGLIACAREKLGGKAVYLGNLVNSYSDWKQTQPSEATNERLTRAPATFRSGRINITQQRLAEEEAARKRALSSMPPPPKSHEELRREAY